MVYKKSTMQLSIVFCVHTMSNLIVNLCFSAENRDLQPSSSCFLIPNSNRILPGIPGKNLPGNR